MSIGAIAARVETALSAGTDLRMAVDEAFDYLDTKGVTWPVHVGVAGADVVVFMPGYGPLSDPLEHVILSKSIS